MFSKLLIANRGEIAVRILRTCREMGIRTVAVYDAADRGSLHVRMADESALLSAPADFRNADVLLPIAQTHQADAIHPGYGFFAEDPAFIRACTQAGIKFIGPSAAVVEATRRKTVALEKVRAAGFPTATTSNACFEAGDLEAIRAEGARLGYPFVLKSCIGGRGRGERLVRHPDKLADALRRAQAEALTIYGDPHVYLEKAVLPAHQISVQIAGDPHGALVHFGEREGSLLYGNQKILEEAPAPCLAPAQRAALHTAALAIAQLFNYDNVGTVEFLVDGAGQFYFTEIKARIAMLHPATEMVTRHDLVREQLRLAAGEPLSLTQKEVVVNGHAIVCRVNAEDPWQNFLPAPGTLRRLRMPGGFEVRVDTFAYSGCDVPPDYDPLIAKVAAWGAARAACVERLQRAIEECKIVGPPSNLSVLQRLISDPRFRAGHYDTDFLMQPYGDMQLPATYFRDLAIVAAVLHARRTQTLQPSTPQRLTEAWHRDSRRLPQ